MNISTEIGSLARRIGERKAIEYYAKAGFDCFDYSMFEMARYDWNNKCLFKNGHPLENKDSAYQYTKELKSIADSLNIKCNQAHAPFPLRRPEIVDKIPCAIKCASIMGAKYCIVHPDNYKTPEENAELFKTFIPFAKENNVILALENMWNWDNKNNIALPAACSDENNFFEHLKIINSEYVVACLDVGHAEMKGLNTSATKMIKTLGKYLKCLHVHDNDLHYDSHQLPFTMNINFDKIIKALKDINYDGDITLEADQYLSTFDNEDLFDGVLKMKEVADKLKNLFLNYK